MAKGLKELGSKEVCAFETRLRRQHAWRRIGEADFDYLQGQVNNIKARLENRDEIDDELTGGS